MVFFGATQYSRDFARRFLAENRRLLLFAAFAQLAVVVYAARQLWVVCALSAAWLASLVWALVLRAARVPEPISGRRRAREQMTSREAFWLDPSAVLDRKRSRDSS